MTLQSLGEAGGFVTLGVTQNHGELVTTDTRRVVALANSLTQGEAKLSKEVVTELVSELVIHGLEAVKVHQYQGEGPAVASAPRGGDVEGLVETATIRDARERIDARH